LWEGVETAKDRLTWYDTHAKVLSFDAIMSHQGNMNLFIIDANSHLFQRVESRTHSGTWSSWLLPRGNTLNFDLAVGRDARNGAIDVFTTDAHDHVLRKLREDPGTYPSQWKGQWMVLATGHYSYISACVGCQTFPLEVLATVSGTHTRINFSEDTHG